MSNFHMIEARKQQERPLRLAQGEAMLAEMNAKCGDTRRAARAARQRIEEQLRAVGFQV